MQKHKVCIGCEYSKECNELDMMLTSITPKAVLGILEEEIVFD